MKVRLPRSRNAWRWLWPLSTALVVRAACGYRGFPAIDDFAYVPVARAALDPTLYAGDVLLQRFLLHSPVWAVIVGIADRTIGIPDVFWLATIALTVATVFAAARLMRTAGVPAYLLPVLVAVGFLGRVQGIGRGAFDGALGNGFHAQWVALCLLLWCYDAFVRRRAISSGVLLGLATLAHPLVGLHGAFALAVATLMARGSAWRELAVVASSCAIVSTPITVPILLHFGEAKRAAAPIAEVVRQGVLFRAPHHYTLDGISTPTLVLVGLLALSGVAATAAFDPRRRPIARPRLVGLCVGHILLLCAALALNGPLRETPIALASFLPYALDLTRTTPLTLVLATLLLIGAVWSPPRPSATRGQRALWLGLVLSFGTIALLGVTWQLAVLVLAVVGIGVRVLHIPFRTPVAAGTLSAILVAAVGWAALHDRRELAPTPDAAALYAWIHDSTATDALFVVPPGFREFRLLAERSIYADFELFPNTSPPDIIEWRRRLELIAQPDVVTAQQRGWAPGVPLWDRSYAVRNTPTRIAMLLGVTGARYFVWDSLAAEAPPYVPTSRQDESMARVVYANARYKVYELSADASRR